MCIGHTHSHFHTYSQRQIFKQKLSEVFNACIGLAKVLYSAYEMTYILSDDDKMIILE